MLPRWDPSRTSDTRSDTGPDPSQEVPLTGATHEALDTTSRYLLYLLIQQAPAGTTREQARAAGGNERVGRRRDKPREQAEGNTKRLRKTHQGRNEGEGRTQHGDKQRAGTRRDEGVGKSSRATSQRAWSNKPQGVAKQATGRGPMVTSRLLRSEGWGKGGSGPCLGFRGLG